MPADSIIVKVNCHGEFLRFRLPLHATAADVRANLMNGFRECLTSIDGDKAAVERVWRELQSCSAAAFAAKWQPLLIAAAQEADVVPDISPVVRVHIDDVAPLAGSYDEEVPCDQQPSQDEQAAMDVVPEQPLPLNLPEAPTELQQVHSVDAAAGDLVQHSSDMPREDAAYPGQGGSSSWLRPGIARWRARQFASDWQTSSSGFKHTGPLFVADGVTRRLHRAVIMGPITLTGTEWVCEECCITGPISLQNGARLTLRGGRHMGPISMGVNCYCDYFSCHHLGPVCQAWF